MMDKQGAINSIRNIAQKMSEYSVCRGYIKSVDEDWPRDDLRNMANLLEQRNWSELGHEELATLGYLWNRYLGKGEAISGYVSHGIIQKEEVISFDDSIEFVSAQIRNNLGIKKYL